MDWHSRFGAPGLRISDNGSHFKNEVVKEVSKRSNANQNFTLAYSPWINGSVERLNKGIVQVLRALCLEYNVDINDWTYFVPTRQANINHTPVSSLGNHTPVELVCVLPAVSPLRFYLDSNGKRLVDLGEHFPEHIEDKLQKLRESAQLMHKTAITTRAEQTNRKRRYLVQADEHTVRVSDLVTGTEQDVHGSRLTFYAGKSFEVTEEIHEHMVSQGIILTVAKLTEHRWNSAKRMHEILVSWKGFGTYSGFMGIATRIIRRHPRHC
ncbi:unnamed protein product [Phytophthora fragariaefolia]|uniref:Unnamed protein product n=1 Tax=Phytophthora fragariaefolia TaxID=1490495 RepID=A0A9W6U4B0_9STRA|nr:unnamed protein product [Phytophthora fragariaefolia]